MNYFYRDSQDREIGPLPMSALSQLRQSGLLSDETLVRAEAESGWVEFSKVNAGPATSTAPASPSNDTPSPTPIKVDRMARAKKFSWLLFVLAVLCFLLPFVEVINRQLFLSGFWLIMGKGGQTADVSLVLGVTIVALLLAITRRPFGMFLSAVTGFVGVASLLMLESSLEQAAARGSEALSIQEGFWLTFALLASGAVVQLILFRQARVNEGWRFRKPHGVTLACLILAVGIIYAAPVLYDNQTNIAPSNQILASEIASKMPVEFLRFKVVATDPKFDQTGEQVSGKAKITLALIAPLYSADDFSRRALEKGDDPQAYAAALNQRNTLPANLAPSIPNTQASNLYAVAKSEGAQISVTVDFTANKVSRGWSFADVLSNWTKHREWIIGKISWPKAPTEFSGLVSRTEVPRGALILSDDSTQQALERYVESRRAFIATVADAEILHDKQVADAEALRVKQAADTETLRVKQLIERKVTEAARAEMSQHLSPGNAYTLSNLKVEIPGDLPDNGNAHVIEATIDIVQTVDLFRLAKEQPSQWEEFQPGSPFEQAKTLANSISAKAMPPRPLDPMVYELASTPHTTTTKFQIEIKGHADALVVDSVTWPDSATFADNSLVTLKDTNANALFAAAPTADSKRLTVQAYRNLIPAFILAVGEEQKSQIEQRYNNYFVSQKSNDRHFDKFSNQDDQYFPVETQQFANSYDVIWNAIAKVMANNHSDALTSDKTFGEISTRFGGSLGKLFQPLEKYRLRILLTNSETGVKVDVKAYLYLAWSSESNRLSKAQVADLYAQRTMKIGTVALTDPQFRDYDGGYWSMYPDTDESKKQGLLFLDQLATELKKSP